MGRHIRFVFAVVLGVLALGALASSASAQDDDDPRLIRVRVQDQSAEAGRTVRTPVAGVSVQVVDAAGATIGEAVTDDQGTAEIPVPGPANYTVILDEDTLPDDTVLTERTPAEREVSEEQFVSAALTVNYFTGEGSRSDPSFLSKLAQRLADGARLGLILAMCAVGLSLIFGTTGLTNFAHGELVTFGAMMAYLFNVTWDLVPLLYVPPLWFGLAGVSGLVFGAVTLALVFGALFGFLLDWGLFARMRKRGIGLISQLVVTVGLSIILRNVFLMRFGGTSRQFSNFNQQTNWELGPVGVTPRDLTTALVSLAMLILVALVLQYSRLGKATRAVSDNPDLAATTGINSNMIIRIVWVVGAMLAALGGIFRGLDEGIEPDMGLGILFLMFAGITLGGLGSPFGALVGSFVVGLFVETSTLWGVPTELKNVPALLVLIVILLVRPQGILGRRERVG